MTNLKEKLESQDELSQVEDIPWFHPSLTRNVTEVLLMTNGVEGNYLIRPSHTHGMYTISVRSLDAVKHFPLVPDGKGGYSFGIGDFADLRELMDHFENFPVLGGESGPPVTLRYPYFHKIAEPSFYVDITRHAIRGKSFTDTNDSTTHQCDQTLSVASKEGFLTKLGAIHKNWKRRWFVTQKHMLYYYNQRGDKKPLRELDLRLAFEAEVDETCQKPNAFRLSFPDRTFYMFADSEKEMEDWVGLFKWKMMHMNKKEHSLTF